MKDIAFVYVAFAAEAWSFEVSLYVVASEAGIEVSRAQPFEMM